MNTSGAPIPKPAIVTDELRIGALFPNYYYWNGYLDEVRIGSQVRGPEEIYRDFLGETDLPNATNAMLTLTQVRLAESGAYAVRVSNALGSVTSQPVIVKVMVIHRVSDWVVVSTLAGSGVPGFSEARGVDAQFNQPNAGFVDGYGFVHVADALNHRIRVVDAAGFSYAWAGTGVAGYRDGPGAQAQFNTPLGVFVAAAGDVFVADTENNRIRKISPLAFRTVSTVSGAGTPGYRDGPKEVAQFNFPNDLVVASNGDLFVTEFNNHTVRRVTPQGAVTTFVGNGSAGTNDGVGVAARLWQPAGLALGRDGTLYVSEWGTHRVRKVTPEGAVSVLAGDGQPGLVDGPAASARFYSPDGLTLDSQGNLYLVEHWNHTVRRITADGLVQTVAGTGVAGFADGDGAVAQFNGPGGAGIAPDGALYVADTVNHRIRRLELWGPSPPQITAQPQSVTVALGQAVVLSVSAQGPGVLSYQWQRNGVDVPGATNASYTIAALNSDTAGAYTVVVSNSLGSVTSGVATLSVAIGPSNRVLTLDGVGAGVSIPSSPELQNADGLTVEAWLYAHDDAANSNPYFIIKSGPGGVAGPRSYCISWPKRVGTFDAELFLGQTGYSVLATPAVRDQWLHLAFTYSAAEGEHRLYINGMLASSATTTYNGIALRGQTVRQTPSPVILSSFNQDSGSFAAGSMDEVRIWNRARTEREIQETMRCRLSGAESGLVAYWNFDAGTPNDATGHGHDGSFFGNAQAVGIQGEDIIHSGACEPRFGFLLTPLRFQATSGFHFTITTPIPAPVRVDVSGNLRDWVTLTLLAAVLAIAARCAFLAFRRSGPVHRAAGPGRRAGVGETPPAGARPRGGTQVAPLDWRSLESTDYRECVQRLRAAGCPKETVDYTRSTDPAYIEMRKYADRSQLPAEVINEIDTVRLAAESEARGLTTRQAGGQASAPGLPDLRAAVTGKVQAILGSGRFAAFLQDSSSRWLNSLGEPPGERSQQPQVILSP